jgi:hypothetical protein
VSEALNGGRFVIIGSLGAGAQGHTFDGVDKREGRPVAIKRFDVRGAKTWKDAELAERETRVLQSLAHPRLPRYYDHFEEDGALYLVMEKIEGENLAAIQRRGGMLSPDEVIRLLRDASDVLEYLHGRTPPVIHRDLKPGNVIRRPDGTFAFVDFGAVRDKLRPEGGSTVVGTFGYMAPEQFQGRALPASDVYAIAATALSMLTGKQPEDLPHKGLAIDVRTVLGGPGPLGRAVPEPLVEALSAMLDPDPDKRPGRIAPVLARLERRAPPRREPARREAPPDRSVPHQVEIDRSSHDVHDAIADRLDAQAAEYEARAAEFERRAAAGGPGSRGWARAAVGWRKGARKMREAADRRRAEVARDAFRRDRRRARKEARRAERLAHHYPRRTGHRPPWPVALFIALLWTAGMIGVALATQVIVPIVLRTLAQFFAARGLNAAADAVREAGEVALANMDRSRRWFLGMATVRDQDPHGAGSGVGAAPAEGGPRVDVTERRVRVGDPEHPDAGAGSEDQEEAEHASRWDRSGP